MSEESETRRVPIDSIVSGPVRHELTQKQTDRLGVIYDICGKATCADTLEEFEIGFMRDLHPDGEIRIWERIAVAFHKAMKRFPPKMSLSKAQSIVQCFILMSANGPDTELPVVAKTKWLRECWKNPVE